MTLIYNETAKEVLGPQEILARLRSDLKNNQLAIVTSAGITLNVTADTSGKVLPQMTWTGLIQNGLDHLTREGFVDESNRRTKRAYDALENPEVDGLLDAANIVSSQMKQHGQLRTWLESVFGNRSHEIRHPALLDKLKELHEMGAILLTTSYDDVLEKHCRLPCVGRSNQDDIFSFQRGDLKGVFHIHGSYLDADEIVLDTVDYYEVNRSDVVQHMLKSFLQNKTLLFVGCSSELDDPNFDALLKWVSEQHTELTYQHYLLVQDDSNLNYWPLLQVKYGSRCEDLALYLNKLLDNDTDAQPLVHQPDCKSPLDHLGGFMIFATEQREIIRAENPSIHFVTGQVGKILREKWKALDEKQRAPYEAKAAQDRMDRNSTNI